MKQYSDLVQQVLDEGVESDDRTGVGTLSLFGPQIEFDLRDGFPLLSLKKTRLKAIVQELLWMLSGETNIKTLGNGIWDEWADEDGELGPIYGKQYRRWGPTEIDQIAELVHGLKHTPESRRLIVTAWNPTDYETAAQAALPLCTGTHLTVEPWRRKKLAALPSCHAFFQCYTSPVVEALCEDNAGVEGRKWTTASPPKRYLDLKLTQRSADCGLGVPYNIGSYAALMHILAREANMIPRRLIMSFGDVHIYKNHVEGMKEMLSREHFPMPELQFPDKPMPYPGRPRDGSVLEPEDFRVHGYKHHPFIKLKVAV